MIELPMDKILQGDCLKVLKTLPTESIDCCITSPPYWALRDYGVEGQLGMEKTPEEFIGKLTDIFREVRRVLKKEGTLWLNLGDSYLGGGFGVTSDDAPITGKQATNRGTENIETRKKLGALKRKHETIKQKDMVGIPWMAAFALRADGWYLRQDIIWAKPNPMPESVTDRCTKSHEYIFLMSKSKQYYFDNEAIKEKSAESTLPRMLRGVSEDHKNVNGAPGQTPHSMNKPRKNYTKEMAGGGTSMLNHNGYFKADGSPIGVLGMRNKRDVWTVMTSPFPEAHFATYPEGLIAPMIKAGCPENGIVLDPFMGVGTTGLVAQKLVRNYIGIELNPEYIKIAEERLKNKPLFLVST